MPSALRKEISKVLLSSYLRGMNLASFFVASKIIVYVTFVTYALLGHVITASRVFVAVTLYSAVRLTVTLFFPSAIEKVSEALVSIRRIKVRPMGGEFQVPCPAVVCVPEILLGQRDSQNCRWSGGAEKGLRPSLGLLECSAAGATKVSLARSCGSLGSSTPDSSHNRARYQLLLPCPEFNPRFLEFQTEMGSSHFRELQGRLP